MASTSAPPQEPEVANQEQDWGRVLIVGGIDWPNIGRKGKAVEGGPRPDITTPSIVRSLSNVKIASIHSSPVACHFVCIDVLGQAWVFGRNESSSLGGGAKSDLFVDENEPKCLTPRTVGSTNHQAKFVTAIIGRNSTLLVDDEGKVYGAGDNKSGQLGLPACPAVANFTKVASLDKSNIVGGSAGGNFTILIAEDGKIYSLGSGEHGQLGNGRTGENIVSAGRIGFESSSKPILVKGDLGSVKIVEVACGSAHTVARDSEGMVYAWGYNGYCRLGLQDQKDRLVPTMVPQFAKENKMLRAKTISCGPACSTVTDNSGIYYMAGRYKVTGEGSGGTPNREFKYLQDMQGCKVFKTSSGNTTHFALAAEHDKGSKATLTIGFGQSVAHSELALGDDSPVSSLSRPTKIYTLDHMEIIDVAAGAHCTLFLCRPNTEAFSNLPRHADVDPTEECQICGVADDEDSLLCDFDDKPFHKTCLNPVVTDDPPGEWFCPDHLEPHAQQGADAKDEKLMKQDIKIKAKRKAPEPKVKAESKKKK